MRSETRKLHKGLRRFTNYHLSHGVPRKNVAHNIRRLREGYGAGTARKIMKDQRFH